MVLAFVLIRVGTGEHMDFEKSVKEKIEKIEGVKTVYRVFGRYDIVTHVETSALNALSSVTDKIRAIEGVLSTESLIIHS
jgi:DNA-binding Lrp family transcriptional regulator